jgi:transposase
MHIERFPAYTPELNPIEQCWKPARAALANRVLRTLPAAQYHLRKNFDNPKSMPKMFQYLRD